MESKSDPNSFQKWASLRQGPEFRHIIGKNAICSLNTKIHGRGTDGRTMNYYCNGEIFEKLGFNSTVFS